MSLEEVNRANAQLWKTLLNPDPQIKLSIANSLWGRKGVTFKPEFLKRNKEFYGAHLRTLDFNLRAVVTRCRGRGRSPGPGGRWHLIYFPTPFPGSGGLGFSKGWAELALKKPPPLVLNSLMAIWDAAGPTAITCSVTVNLSVFGSLPGASLCCPLERSPGPRWRSRPSSPPGRPWRPPPSPHVIMFASLVIARHMRDALPKATFVAFTGTPMTHSPDRSLNTPYKACHAFFGPI
jgi:hypothetical protein